MGAAPSCSVKARSPPVDPRPDSESSLDSPPEPMDNIMGIDIDRESPKFQKALRLTTELVVQYRDAIYPASFKLTLDLFADSRYPEFREICGEVHNDLVFDDENEIEEKMEDELYVNVRNAIHALAEHYTTMSLNINQAVTMHFEDYYDDALRVIVTDIERKQFWRKKEACKTIKFMEP